MAKGIRVSPGVYRDAKTGKTYQSTTGKAPAAKKKGMKDSPIKSVTASQAMGQLTQPEQQIVQNQEQRDIGMGEVASGLQGQVANTYKDPFQYTGPGPATASPEERLRIENELSGRFERYDAPLRQQENEDLARWAQSTGNSVDSPAYAARQKQLADQQNARRLDATTRAVEMGGTEYERSFNMGNDAFRTNYGLQRDMRAMPMEEYGQVQGAIQGYQPATGFMYDQRGEDLGLGRQKKLAKFTSGLNRGGGGGGGGGGMIAPPQAYQPQYLGGQTQSQPSYWGQVASSLGAPIAQGVGSYIGKQAPGWISSLFE